MLNVGGEESTSLAPTTYGQFVMTHDVLTLLEHMFRSTVLIESFSTSLSSTAHTLAYESKVHVGGARERLPLNGTSSPRQVHRRGTFPSANHTSCFGRFWPVCSVSLDSTERVVSASLLFWRIFAQTPRNSPNSTKLSQVKRHMKLN